MEKDSEWFGIVRWCNDDISNALKEAGYEVTDENINKIRTILEHHSFQDLMVETGWDIINTTIEENIEHDYRICSCCGKKIHSGYTDEEDYWCENCFKDHMNKIFGEKRWTSTNNENCLNGFYYYLNDRGDWEPLNIYWTEWSE